MCVSLSPLFLALVPTFLHSLHHTLFTLISLTSSGARFLSVLLAEGTLFKISVQLPEFQDQGL